MIEYEMLSMEMRLQQVDARLFQVEQELFNAQLNLEMESVIDDTDRQSLVQQFQGQVAMAEKRLARLREIKAELSAVTSAVVPVTAADTIQPAPAQES